MSKFNKQPSDIDKYVGLQLRQARRELKISQEQLGDMIGITFQQVQKYERGVNRIASGRLYEFALALKRPITYFYPDIITDIDEDAERAESLMVSDLQKMIKKNIDEITSTVHLHSVFSITELMR